MVPRPKTYGAQRSRAKLAGGLVNGITGEESENILKKFDIMSLRTRDHKRKDIVIAPKGEKHEDVVSQIWTKEDESASGEPEGEHASPSRTMNAEDKSTTLSPVARTLQRKKKMSARDMLPPDISLKQTIRSSINGSTISETQDCIPKTALQSILLECTSPSHPEATLRPNGFTADHQQSPLEPDIGLKYMPSNLKKIAFWVAHFIRKDHQNESHSSSMPEPRQKESSPQPGQDIEMSDALENVDVRMTRGSQKRRLQQLKGTKSVNDLSDKFATGQGKALKSKDAAPVERMLRESLNDELKQRLFGPLCMTDMSTSVIERNACGKLMFNTIVDMGDLANTSSAGVLKSALEETKDVAPFLSALEILASSSEVMAFINFISSKDDTPHWVTSNAADSRPSTGLGTSGATTTAKTSGSTSLAGKSLTESEALFKSRITDKPLNKKHPGPWPEKQKQSQEVTQALEAATMVLVQIQQGEIGAGYVTPYASSSIGSNPGFQRHPTNHSILYGPPHPNHFTHGMAYGPPVGPNFINYASPYAPPLAMHPNSYASPYSNPVTQFPSNYASPYANPMAASQIVGPALVSSVKNQANKHDDHETHHDNKEVDTSLRGVSRAEAKKGDDGAASHYISSQGEDASNSSIEADKQGMSDGEDETSQAYDQDTRQGISIGKDVASNVVDLDEQNVDIVQAQDRGGEDGEINNDDDLTEDELHADKPDDMKITPPAKDHKLFTGERLGDFNTREEIDWLLIMSNGGKIPRPSKKKTKDSRSTSPASPTDIKVQMEVSKIINEIMHYKDWRGHPLCTTRQLFYASAEGQRLAAELRRLMAIAKPVLNTIIPSTESQARLRFYQQLESRAIKEKRDFEIQQDMNRFYGAQIQIQQWNPPPALLPPIQSPVPTPMPIDEPVKLPFVRRGNVIAAPPGGRNIEDEKKAETYGYPPTPGSRPGGSKGGKSRKKARRH